MKKTNQRKKIPAKPILYLDAATSEGESNLAEITYKEIKESEELLSAVGPCISVFGSARFQPEHPYYEAAVEFGKRIAQMNFTTVTGGGPGIMEAANKGAFNANGHSIGLNIVLPFEQHENAYLTHSYTFEHFFTRKVMLVKFSYAFIIMPGGIGTMDEFYETLTLIQTKTIKNFPMVVFGKKYYRDVIEMLEVMKNEGTISPEDLDLVLFTDSHDEAMAHIQKYIASNYRVLQSRKKNWWT